MVTSTTRTLSAGRLALSADLAGLSEIRRNPSRSAARGFDGASSAPRLDHGVARQLHEGVHRGWRSDFHRALAAFDRLAEAMLTDMPAPPLRGGR